MDAIREWAVTLCMGAIVAAIAKMLIPSGRLEKIYRIVVGAFFLCCMISPFLSWSGNLDLEVSAYNDSITQANAALEQEVNGQILSQAKRTLTAACEERLEEIGVSPKKITMNMDIADDGGISIKQVEILLLEEDALEIEAVSAAVKEVLGISPTVQAEGPTGGE